MMVAVGTVAVAGHDIPKASAKALGVTKGKPFSSGVAFVDGKYIEPPYVVERWGTGLRINAKPVSGQIIKWDEFLRAAQRAERHSDVEKEIPLVAAAAVEPEKGDEDLVDDTSSLDDLFDDAEKSEDTQPTKPDPKPSVQSVKTGPIRTQSFVPNEVTRLMVSRINAIRTEVDRVLRSGGFVCFGESYDRITGDSRTALKLMEVMPHLLRQSESEADFKAKMRAAKLDYLNPRLCDDLYRNRFDYPKLQKRYGQMKSDAELARLLNNAN